MVIAYPELIPGTPTDTLSVDAVEGERVILPCDIERSFLGQFIATWSRVTGSRLVQIVAQANPDYSLTLNDLKIGESGTYRCTVVANSSFLPQASQRSAFGRSIHLTVRNRHSKFHAWMSTSLLYNFICLIAWCIFTILLY